MDKQSVILCILDGVGWGLRDDGDAVYSAHTPHLDRLMKDEPWGLLKAHGTAVGMPTDGDMGNSEVGHNAMGAGRIFAQGAKLVQSAIETGQMWESPIWKKATQGKCLHFMGLTSDGNVHSHIDHLRAMINQANIDGVKKIRLHVLTDGRDVLPRSALTYTKPLETFLQSFNQDYAIASGGGRMLITMDRYEADWPMVKRGYDCHVHAKGRRFASASEAIQTLYDEDPKVDDQWLPPFVVGDYQGMEDGDAVLFFNFRGDRAIEISMAMELRSFDKFDRQNHPDVFYAGMMEYDGDLKLPSQYLVSPPAIDDTIGERMAAASLKVLSISETQKFGHVTYFFNGNKSKPLPGEDQQEIPSANVPFDQQPQMSAFIVTEKTCEAIRANKYDHIRLNIANGDMVGHTGNFSATVNAMEIVDQCVGELEKAARETNSILLITADHGNADEMYQTKKKAYRSDQHGNRIPSTSHSKNPVPYIVIDPQKKWMVKHDHGLLHGGLAQIGGTVLNLLHLPVPEHYLPSLVKKHD